MKTKKSNGVIKFISSILFFLIISATISAQQVYFADSFTEDGEPIGAKNEWEIKPWGSFVYVLLDPEETRIKGNIIYLFVDRLEGDSYEPFDSKAINIGYGRKFVAYNYKFTKTGKYEVYFIAADQTRIAGEQVTIKFEESFINPVRNTSSAYYDDCKITFCKKILVGGETLGVMRSTSISRGGNKVFIQLNNYKPLNTSKFLVDVWRKKNRAFQYDEFVESKKYSLNPDWNDAFFSYTFTQPGDYKFSVYNEDEVLIKSGFFTVYD
ncbi:MAG: hypothetical protein JW995_12900 [Melioribacteraceae bacterium]|nr:hypothetical protein [Melioribacteraceae bacterium]